MIDKDHFFYIRRYGFCYQDTTRSIRLDENVTRMFHVVDDSYYIDDKGVDRVYV